MTIHKKSFFVTAILLSSFCSDAMDFTKRCAINLYKIGTLDVEHPKAIQFKLDRCAEKLKDAPLMQQQDIEKEKPAALENLASKWNREVVNFEKIYKPRYYKSAWACTHLGLLSTAVYAASWLLPNDRTTHKIRIASVATFAASMLAATGLSYKAKWNVEDAKKFALGVLPHDNSGKGTFDHHNNSKDEASDNSSHWSEDLYKDKR